MATVQVVVYGTLKIHVKYLEINNDEFNIVLQDNSTVMDLIRELSIPLNEVHNCFINGVCRSFEEKLKHGDRVALLPPIAGG